MAALRCVRSTDWLTQVEATLTQQQPRRFSRPYEQVFDVDALAAYLSTARPEDVALSDCLEDNPVRFGEGNVARVVLVSRVPEWLQTIEVVPTWDSVRTHKLSSNTATVHHRITSHTSSACLAIPLVVALL